MSKADEYLICKQRGHEKDYDQTAKIDGKPDYHKDVCKWCGVIFWEETIEHELPASIPKPRKTRDITIATIAADFKPDPRTAK